MSKTMPKSGHKEAPIGKDTGKSMGGKLGTPDAMHSAGSTKPTFQQERMKRLEKMPKKGK